PALGGAGGDCAPAARGLRRGAPGGGLPDEGARRRGAQARAARADKEAELLDEPVGLRVEGAPDLFFRPPRGIAPQGTEEKDPSYVTWFYPRDSNAKSPLTAVVVALTVDDFRFLSRALYTSEPPQPNRRRAATRWPSTPSSTPTARTPTSPACSATPPTAPRWPSPTAWTASAWTRTATTSRRRRSASAWSRWPSAPTPPGRSRRWPATRCGRASRRCRPCSAPAAAPCPTGYGTPECPSAPCTAPPGPS